MRMQDLQTLIEFGVMPDKGRKRTPEHSPDQLQDLTIEEARALIKKMVERKPSKYRNKKTAYKDRVYDSKREAEYAMQLDAMLKAGVIQGWTPQVDFDLMVDGQSVGKYRADFVVRRNSDKHPAIQVESVHEVKGYETREWKLKRRIFMINHPNYQLRVIR